MGEHSAFGRQSHIFRSYSNLAHSSDWGSVEMKTKLEMDKFGMKSSIEHLKCEPENQLLNSHHEAFLSVSERMFLDEIFVDVKICCQGVEFLAHKFLLAAFSPFFRDRLYQNEEQIEIDFIQPRIFIIILKFLYTGRLPIRENDEQILKELIECCVTLRICPIYFHCLQLLLHRPTREGFVLCWDTIEGYNSRNISKCYLEYFISNIYFLKDTQGFLNIPLRRMILLLKFPRELNSNKEDHFEGREDNLLDCLLAWLKKDFQRKKHLQNLAQYISFDDLSKEYMMNLLETEDFIQANSYLAKCLISALQKQNSKFTKTSNDSVCLENSELMQGFKVPEFGKALTKVISATESFPAVDKPTLDIDATCPDRIVINLAQSTAVDLESDCPIKNELEKFKQQTVLIEKVLCVYGMCSFKSKQSVFVQKFFFTDKHHWIMLQTYPNNYCNKVAACAYGGLIFYCGGQHKDDHTISNGFWSFNYWNNVWRPLKPMVNKRCDACMIRHYGSLYVIGGSNSVNSLDSVEEYNIEEDIWNRLASLPHPISRPVATVSNGIIWVADKKQLLMYQPLTNTWFCDVSLPREIIAIDVVMSSNDSKLYLIPKMGPKSVYEYCTDEQVWSKCVIPVQIAGECYSMLLTESPDEYVFFILTSEAVYGYKPPCTWKLLDDMTHNMTSVGAVILEIVRINK